MSKKPENKSKILVQNVVSLARNYDIGNKLKEKFSRTINLAKYLKDNIRFEYKAAAISAFTVVLAFSVAFMPIASKPANYAQLGKEAEKGKIAAEDKDQYIISIGGEMVLAVASEEDAKAVYEGIKYYYLNGQIDDPTAEVSFDREFRWDLYNAGKEGGETAWEMTPVEAVNYILKGKGETKVHTAVGGDNLWDIAIANSTTVDELLAMNPGLTEDNLKIGMQVNLQAFQPYMYVTTVQETKVQESIPYETVYEDTEALFKGQTKVSKPGQNGSKDVLKKITKLNGMVVGEETLSETLISEPQTQIALKGTKSMSYSVVGSVNTPKKGILGYPMARIEVSSPFGVSRGSSRHTGVDFRNPIGTPIVAAEAGTVVFSGMTRGYGNLVKIDHGGGLQTWYAHCDKLIVSSGNQVVRGQTIATVGLTGYTTGAHCHFEVRLNGTAQNPLNYL